MNTQEIPPHLTLLGKGPLSHEKINYKSLSGLWFFDSDKNHWYVEATGTSDREYFIDVHSEYAKQYFPKLYKEVWKNEEEVNVNACLEEFLAKDNNALQKSGCELAQAALEVIKNHDGLHRLALAIADWSKTIANEGGRKEQYKID